MTFTIEEIRNYLKKQDSFGDALYNLSEQAIIEANEEEEEDYDPTDNLEVGMTDSETGLL